MKYTLQYYCTVVFYFLFTWNWTRTNKPFCKSKPKDFDQPQLLKTFSLNTRLSRLTIPPSKPFLQKIRINSWREQKDIESLANSFVSKTSTPLFISCLYLLIPFVHSQDCIIYMKKTPTRGFTFPHRTLNYKGAKDVSVLHIRPRHERVSMIHTATADGYFHLPCIILKSQARNCDEKFPEWENNILTWIQKS